MQCAACGSPHIQNVALVYESGVSSFEASSTGAAFSGGGFGVGAGTTHGTQMTALAQRIAPPHYFGLREWCWCLIWIFATGLIGFAFPFLWIITALIVLAIVGGVAHNRKKYPGLLQEWQQQFLCLRCGTLAKPSLER